jgi:hypothetical protein
MLENIILSGIINLGKYTFPKMVALSLKTVDVLMRQSEK